MEKLLAEIDEEITRLEDLSQTITGEALGVRSGRLQGILWVKTKLIDYQERLERIKFVADYSGAFKKELLAYLR